MLLVLTKHLMFDGFNWYKGIVAVYSEGSAEV